MIYSATYETTTEVIELAIEMINADTYYAVQNGGWGPCYGTEILMHDRENGEFYVNVNGARKPLKEIDASDIMSLETVGWTACSGNYMGITFREDGTCLLEIDSRRHGVPFKDQLIEALKGAELLSVRGYDSARDHWEWYETLENHQVEGPIASFETEDLWDAEPKRISLKRS